MKIIVLYRPNSEHARSMESLVREYVNRYGNNTAIDLQNIDTREGMALASLYGILQYPAILVMRDDGYLQKYWEGETMPLLDEVQSYARG